MKVRRKIGYSPDVDILMIQLSGNKVDDAYETDQMIVHVDKKGEPVLLEIFNGKQYLKELSKTLPKNVREELSGYPYAVPHQIKK